MTRLSRLWLALILFAPALAHAQVGDPTLRTDHAQYAGEGAFQTIEQCVEFATADGPNASGQQQALAMYKWLLTHQYHAHSPQEWNVPGLIPGATSHSDMSVYDANRSRFSYGYGLCGNVHAWNEPYWRALGMAPRRRAFPGHTNSEIKYAGSWHAFDTDMAGLVFRPDGQVAGYADIAKNPAIVKPETKGVPCYPFAWPSDFKVMQQGWKQVAQGGNWYALYNGGYAAQPGIVSLRVGETFTRWFDRDHYGGPSKRRFWHKQPGGPFRDWTFVNMGEPQHRISEQGKSQANSRGNASYCNGEFVYEPKLAEALGEGIVWQSENVAGRDQSPRLHSANGKPAAVTFHHFSPYVICGDPADDMNPMSGPASGGLVVSGKAVGKVKIEVSVNHGQSWQQAGQLEGDFQLDLTDAVKGRYGWQLRFRWQGTSGLDQLRFVTVTQVSQMIYPRLTADGSQVSYQAASRAVVPVLPDLELPEQEQAYEVQSMRSDNVRFASRTKKNRFAYQTTNNKPASIVFRVDAPRRLVEVHAAVRYGIRVPPPAETDYRLEVSTDEGKTWQPMARAEIPTDNEYSSGWLAGETSLSTDVTSALVRVTFYAGGYTTGIIEAELYGVYQSDLPGAVELTYGWNESGESRTHVERIKAGAQSHRFTVPTGANVQDEFVRMSTLP
jgi:hypothetical protein